MLPVKVGSTFAITRWKATVVLLSLGFALLSAQPGQAQGSLQFFKNYFITGDYAVGGASLWQKGSVDGNASVEISVPGVPRGADILAAYLYVQTAETDRWSGIDHATFNGYDLGPGSSSLAKALNWELATTPCWTVAYPGGRRLVTYRADVLRFLPVGIEDGPQKGKQVASGPHTLEVPDSGTAFADVNEGGTESGGGSGPRAIGASLVVVYRDPLMPFKAVVIYDGGFKKTAFATMNQTIAGFYQAATTPAAKMTHIVGDGRQGVSERVFLDGQLFTNPFVGAEGPKWDNPTFPLTSIPPPLDPGGASVAVKVAPNGLLSDCLCYSGIVLSTEVQDSDKDGLLDVWETNPSLVDPNGQRLPNLAAMGANPTQKDLFIEIGYMKTDAETSYGDVPKPAHSHLPTPAALKLMGDAFANSPSPIRVHFDVGDPEKYHLLPAYSSSEADLYIIGTGTTDDGLARGGEAIDEMDTVCPPGGQEQPWVCQFSEYPGTVGWKTGFKFLRDQVLSGEPAPQPGEEDPCDLPGSACVNRFDRNRKDMFRYALFAHALGLPKSEEPLDSGFHVPRTNTGVGDFPGGDVMVTLGAFSDTDGLPVGTPFMQASTLMHELGHNMERRHGGEAFEPNCKPTYLSVMNYLYQLRGLLDDSGKPNLDFSRSIMSPAFLDEKKLLDGTVLTGWPTGPPDLPKYRIGWYAPLLGSYLEGRGTPALRHCDGSDLLILRDAGGNPILDSGGKPTYLEPPMVRIDARAAEGAIDWNADGILTEPSFALDINFNGRPDGAPDPTLNGSDDWSNILLNQIGARRNTGGLFVVDREGQLLLGPMSLDSGRGDLGRGDLGRGDLGGEQGRGDLGRGDLGRGDLGRGDLGRGDLGRGDLGRGDLGRGDLGRGDLGRGDLGGGDLFVGDPDSPGGELDFETATDLAKTPPNEFTATISGSGVLASWKAPNIGGVTGYSVYRVPGNALLPEQLWKLVSEVPPGTYTLVDDEALFGTDYVYFAVATYADGIQSDPSNLVTLTTPKASSTVTVTCPPTSVSYTGSPLTPCSVTVTGAGGLNLTPTPSYLNNTFPGTATASYTFDGNASYEGSSSEASFTIAQAVSTVIVSCPPSVVYSGSALTPCTAQATGVGIAPVDVTALLVYGNNTNAGAATVSGSWDGDTNNSGSNASGGFTIAQASSTVTVSCAVGAPYTYTGSAQTPCTAQATGVGIDPVDVTASLVYDNNTDAGAATAEANWVGDANHTLSSGSAGFTIDKAPVTATAGSGSTTYDGVTHAPSPCAVTGGYTGDLWCTNSPASVGPAANTYAIGRTVTGTGLANFAITPVDGSYTITPKLAVATATPVTGVYNGSAYSGNGACSDGLAPVFTYAGGAAPVNAGTTGFTVTCSGSNYITATATATIAIAQTTPVFSGLSAPTISAGATPTALAGTLKSGTLVPSGSVSITLNGVTQSAPITATGAFSSSFATGALAATGSPYTITYSYAGDTNFTAAGPDTSKSLTVKPVGYVLYGVKVLPPAICGTFKPSSSGTLVDLEWKFKNQSGAVVNSADALPVVTVTGPGGYSKTYSAGAGCVATNACGSFSYKASENKWDVHWQPKNAAVGTYNIVVTSQKTGQRFPETGGYPVVFKQ